MPPSKPRNGHDESRSDAAHNHHNNSNSKDGHAVKDKDREKENENHKEKERHDKNGHSTPTAGLPGHHTPHLHHHSNGKMRRVASSTSANARESAAGPSSAVHHSTTAIPVPIIGGMSSAAASSSSSSAQTAVTAQGAAAQDPESIALQWPTLGRSLLHDYRRHYRLNTPTSFTADYHKWVLSRPGSLGLRSPTMLRNKTFRRQGKDDLAGVVRKHYNNQGIQENDVIVEFLHKVKSIGGGGGGGGSGIGGGVASGVSVSTAGVSKPASAPRTRRKEPQHAHDGHK